MNKEEIIEKLKSGEIKIYEIENHVDPSLAIEIRRAYISEISDSPLKNISNIAFDPEQVLGSNCENVIGHASVPVGVAGPIEVSGEVANGSFIIPLATTEGALVASVNRGISIINSSGGAITKVIDKGISRAPVFQTKDLEHSFEVKSFVDENFSQIKETAEKTSEYLKLLKAEVVIHGRSLWVRMNFSTDQAMGMNMAVVASEAAAHIISSKTGARLIALSGNLCIDKKPALVNSILGRGKETFAEVLIPKEIVEKKLKSSVDEIVEVNRRKTWEGSAMSGSLGFNAHVANMVAAIFIATGQDPAHVVDASVSYVTMEKSEEDLYVSLKIPSLEVGSVGGGTKLATQNELLNLILTNVNTKKIDAENKALALAEIITAATLAGEISLAAAFASDTFTEAHESLGRSKIN
jgi:hydroxymethylglutaryl-CoA reductase (NADPH)